MRRWVPIIFMAFFCVFLLSGSVQQEPELMIVKAFQELHVESDHYVLHYGSTLPLMSQQEVVNVLKPFQDCFQLPIYMKKDQDKGIIYHAVGSFQQFHVKLTLFCGEGESGKHPYLSIQIERNGSFDKELLNIKRNLAHILRINNLKPQFDFSIQGNHHSLDDKKIMNEALLLLHAKEVESMRTKTVSISAYSLLLGDGVRTKGGEMNAQIATKVDEVTKKLIVTMGTPIITVEY